MRILTLHTYYEQPGGEDEVFMAEAALLQERGHEVIKITFHNRDLEILSRWRQAPVTLWNWRAYRHVREAIQNQQPQVVHVHNTFPLASPAVIHGARAEGVPVVVSLHNPRLMCPSANFWYRGRLCTQCLGKFFAWPGVMRGCYRGSKLYTLGVAAMVSLHKCLGTWSRLVDKYIVFTELYRDLFIQAGIPASKIAIKPHFVADPKGLLFRRSPMEIACESDEKYAIFVGRLDPEKGILPLINAWKILHAQGLKIRLKIRGHGRLSSWIWQEVQTHGLDVECLPRLSKEDLFQLIANAQFLVWPSEGWYETFGLVAVEAFACGTPVLASGTGVALSIVRDGVTGIFFRPGDPEDLAVKVRWLLAYPEKLSQMRKEARAEYESKYTPEKNYELLMDIYSKVIKHKTG